MPRNTLLQFRRGTASNWTSANSVLAAGEVGYETDTGKFKIGDGTTAWTALLYATDASDLTGTTLSSSVVSSSLTSVGTLSSLAVSGGIAQGGNYLTPYSGFRNKIINGSFEIWQRGTSRTYLNAGSFRADRWTVNQYQNAAHQQVSVTPVTGMQTRYALRSGSSTVAEAGGGARMWVNTTLESADSIPLRGQTVTLSFWVRFSSATCSSSTGTAYGNWTSSITYYTSTTDASTATTGPSSSTDTTITNGSLPTTWTKYTITGTVPSNANNVGVQFGFAGLGNTASNDAVWYEVTQVQLEQGSVATPFEQRPIDTELSLCERYFQLWRGPGGSTANQIGFGNGYNSTSVFPVIRYKRQMRAVPTSIIANDLMLNDVTTAYSITAISLEQIGIDGCRVSCTISSGGVQYRGYAIQTNTATTSYFGISAEF